MHTGEGDRLAASKETILAADATSMQDRWASLYKKKKKTYAAVNARLNNI